MAEKMENKEKKTAPAKKPTIKTTFKPKVKKGDGLICGVCGLSVIVDECGDVEAEEILCCGKPMKQKATRVKASAK